VYTENDQRTDRRTGSDIAVLYVVGVHREPPTRTGTTGWVTLLPVSALMLMLMLMLMSMLMASMSFGTSRDPRSRMD